MINSAIILILILILLSFEHAKPLEQHTKNKKQTHQRKRKERNFTQKHKISLSLSLSQSRFVPPSLSSRFWLPATSIFWTIFFLINKKQKTVASFPHIGVLVREPRDVEPARITLTTKKNRASKKREPYHKNCISIVKIMFAMRTMRSAAPTTTQNQKKRQHFSPKRIGGIRIRRCRPPLIAMSIPQQGGNAQKRESLLFSLCLSFSFSFSVSILSIRAVSRSFIDFGVMNSLYLYPLLVGCLDKTDTN